MNFNMNKPFLFVQQVVCGIILTAFLPSCSSEPPMASASGVVSLDGKPLKMGRVGFLSKETGKGASAKIGPTGEFSLDSPVPPGSYTVTVIPPETAPPVEGEPVTPEPTFEGFPKKYRSAETSDLTVDVQEGENQFEIKMVP